MDLFICVYHLHIGLSVSCSLAVTCLERADFFGFPARDVFLRFVTFPYGVLGQVWYLIVSIPDLCFA